MNRRFVTIVLIVLILAFPYWLYLPALLLAAVLLPFYAEAIVFAFIIDVLYGTRIHSGVSFAFPFAIIAACVVLIMLPIQKRLRFNA
jgi:hypothetical protein